MLASQVTGSTHQLHCGIGKQVDLKPRVSDVTQPIEKRSIRKVFPRFEPCYGLREVAQSLRTLFRAHDENTANLSASVLRMCNISERPAYMASSARECICLALRLLSLGDKSRVGVQLFCCPCVFEAVVAAGHVPVFVDIDESTYGVSPMALADVKDTLDALIIVHTFGYPVDIEKIRASLGNRAIPIIEDCAHALFSEYRGSPVGTSTEMSVFSFGLRKPAAAGGGGLLVINNVRLDNDCLRSHTRLDNTLQEILHTLNCFARSVAYDTRAYTLSMFLSLPYGRSQDDDRSRAEDCLSCSPLSRSLRRIRRTDSAGIGDSINRFEVGTSTIQQHVKNLRDALNDTFLTTLSEPSWGKWNHFWVPIRFPSPEQYERGQAILWRRRVDAAPVWRHCAIQARRFGYRGGCPQAETTAKTVCRLPPISSVSDSEMEYICESLRLSGGVTRWTGANK